MNRYIDGYSVEEIAEMDGQTVRNINGILNSICKAISNEEERQWRIWSYTHKLELKSKKCSRCEEELPATDEFFGADDRNKEGFQGICKKCDSLRKLK